MTEHTIESRLPDDQRGLYAAVVAEIQPLVDDESYTQAIARVDMILKGIPVDQDHRLLRAAFLAKRGELRLDDESYEEAEEDLRHALHNGMKLPSVWAHAGWAQYHMERPEKARDHFDQVLEVDPDDVSALTGRALVYQELDEHDKARADLTHAIHVSPGNESLYAMRAEVHARLGEAEQAERDIREARNHDPEDPDYALLAARLAAVRADLPAALAAIEVAVTSVDDEPSLEALLLRSHLRLLNGQPKRARADAMSASNRFPDEAFALVQLAHVQLTQGNVALAMKAAERAVKLDPSLPDAYLVRGAAARLNGDEEGATRDFQRASQAPSELPMFLFGPAHAISDEGAFDASILDLLQGGTGTPAQAGAGAGANPFAGMGGFPPIPGMGGPGGMDPFKMMGQMFDDEGNIRGPFKPLVQMALKNAPSILKNMPKGMLKNMGGVDPSMLDQIDLESMTPEQLEAQMKEFAKLVKSGQNPMEMMQKAQEELDRRGGKDD